MNKLVAWMRSQQSALIKARNLAAQAGIAARTNVAEVKAIQAEMRSLKNAVDKELESVLEDLESAGPAVSQAERAMFQGVGFLEALAETEIKGQVLADQQCLIDQRLNQLSREVEFITRDAETNSAAMLTLTIMRSNGYQLRESNTEAGLVSYFEQEGTGHHIAVRMTHVGPVSETGADRWDLLAETFGPAGNQCLEEIMDFETAAQKIDLGCLERKGPRLCPKDGTDYASERWVKVPSPRTSKQSGQSVKLQARLKEKAK